MTRARHPNIAANGTWIWSGYENASVPPKPNMSFTFADTTAAKLWAPAVATGSLWLHGFFKFDCTPHRRHHPILHLRPAHPDVRCAGRDTFIRIASLKQSSNGSGFTVTRDVATPPSDPFTKGCRFYAVGALELLDAPGEYHVDKATGLMHFLPLAPLTARTDVVVSLLDTVVSAAGTRHMVWKDLTISVSRGTMSARGDGLGAAFDCTGCVNVSVENCNVTNAGTTCLNLVGGANNTAVRREIFLGNSRKIVSKRAHRQHAS